MRLFVALRPPSDALAHAGAAVDAVRAVEPGPRWVPPERWHLTLAFYGEVADGDLAGVHRRIDRAVARATAMTLRLRGAGSFPRRAVWLGVDGDVQELRRVAAGVSREPRTYRPHLTVARLRGDTDPAAAVAALSSYDGPPWPAEAVHLVRSHLGPHPRHEDVASWPLRPRPW